MITLISQRTREIGNSKSDCLEQPYVEYLGKFGFDLIPVPNSAQNLDFYFSLPVERVILTGGGDIGDIISQERDKTEKALLDFAIKKRIPVLGICRGMQFMNFYFGGKLRRINEISNQSHVSVNHDIRISAGELREVIGEQIKVNSYHNYGLTEKDLSSKLKLFAKAYDETIEGLYHPQLPMGGIIWHPERESPDKEANEKIIKAFLKGEVFWKK